MNYTNLLTGLLILSKYVDKLGDALHLWDGGLTVYVPSREQERMDANDILVLDQNGWSAIHNPTPDGKGYSMWRATES